MDFFTGSAVTFCWPAAKSDGYNKRLKKYAGDKMHNNRLMMAVMLVLAGKTSVVQAARGIEEVLVTAQKREESIREVPMSVGLVSGEGLKEDNIDSLSELGRAVPGFTLTGNYQGGGANAVLTVRGVGTIAAEFQSVQPSVGTVIDGVVIGRTGAAYVNFNDVARVEVLRGPQGTLFGMNASAGLLNIVTNGPTQDFEAKLGFSYGSYDDKKFNGMVSGPLIGEALLGRLAVYANKRDGYVRNIYDGKDVGALDEKGFRTKFLFQPRDTTELLLNIDYADSVQKPRPSSFVQVDPSPIPTYAQLYAGGLAGPENDRVNALVTGESDSRSRGVSLQWDEEIGDHTLTSITAWRRWSYEDDTHANPTPVPLTLGDSSLLHEQWSQELRITSPKGGAIDYVAGVFVFDQSLRQKNRTIFDILSSLPIGFGSAAFGLWDDYKNEIDTFNYAGFGELNFHPTDTLTLIAGARWTHEEVDSKLTSYGVGGLPGYPPGYFQPLPNSASPGVLKQDVVETNWSWRVGARWDVTPDHMVYGTVSRGYKGPAFNSVTSVGFARTVNPEISTNYEIGMKSVWLDNLVRTNISVFYTEFKDFQASTNVFVNNFRVGSSLLNAGKLETKGVEFELEAAPVDNLTLSFNVAYIDGKFEEFTNAPCYTGIPVQTAAQGCVAVPGGSLQDISGAPLANTPEWSYNIAARYDIPFAGLPFDGFVRANYNWRDEVQWNYLQDPFTVQDSYGLLGLTVGIKDKDNRYTVSAYSENLLDEFYNQGMTYANRFGYGQSLAPTYKRTWGVLLEYRFD